ncbi:TonB-dependent receptor [Halalkalibaculum sp. DA384]|uniref:TonB-dependent receptor n=1 Tax=Halalkalibaculum sp. DA384 TaxID=3373606 RepID=UPI003754BAD3
MNTQPIVQRTAVLFFLLFPLCCLHIDAKALSSKVEVTISGVVIEAETDEPLPGVNVKVKGKVIGTSTGLDGQFQLRINQDPPLTLVFSSVGFKTVEVEITSSQPEKLTIRMEQETLIGSDVVVSASRVEESILEAPVSIEKMDIISIQQNAAPTFYDALANMKGVDFSTQSLTFKSVNTRGFGANGNVRFVQLIDGIDNQAPGLNFPVGNVVGISELDLESAELIPGVASALYGANALNGILLLNSKSPFDYEGLSVKVKQGLNHVQETDHERSLYQQYLVRYAKSYNNKVAFKVNGSFLKAQDFVAVDYRDIGPASFGAIERGATSRGDNRVYNGLNVYGDDLLTIGTIADAQIAAGNSDIAAIRSLLPDGEAGAFTPLGYTESSFVDNTTESLKLNAALHYRINDDLELLGQYNIGFGSTVYTANDRFVLDDFSIWTGKIELRNPNFFLRAYTTQEDAGDTYAANTVATQINLDTYVPAYFQAFAQARIRGATVQEAHMQAENAGAQARLEPESTAFQQLFNEIRSIPISEGGARFLDKSDLWHAEGKYNFSEIIDPEIAELITGASYRKYALDSGGTLFALQEDGDEFDIDEFGAYLQISKTLLDQTLDLQSAVRYDKNEYFEGQFSPRFSAVYTVAENHNLRASFQRGFRIPTTQTQFIDLDVVRRRLIGSNQTLIDRYNLETNTVYSTESVQAARQADDISLLEPIELNNLQTEKVNTFEVGYKALIRNRLLIDASYYYSSYNDFIAEIDLTQAVDVADTDNRDGFDPVDGFNPDSDAGKRDILNNSVAGGRLQRYGFDINADGTVESQGVAVSAELAFNRGYKVGGNISYSDLISQQDLIDQGFRASYNTPEWKYNIQFSNRRLTDRLGFNIVYRWQDAFLWESSFGQGVVPAFGTLDAQVSYKLPVYNTILKVGGSNILNERYTTSIGNPRLGALYYVSLTFDQFLN